MEDKQFEDDLLRRMVAKRQAGASLETVIAHILLLSRVSNESDKAFAHVIVRLINPQPHEHTHELQSGLG